MEKKKVKVLIVDDSSLIRRMLIDMLNSHPDIQVVGFAINGEMALSQIKILKPDVITLDVEMPKMNGLETLKEIKKIKQIPVIMFSSLTKSGAETTLQALELGAFDFLQKPENFEKDIKYIEKELITKILAAAQLAQKTEQAPQVKHIVSVSSVARRVSKNTKTVVIGTSTGGPQALKNVLPYLPADLPAQILVVQHMPPTFTNLLAQRLDKISEIKVKEAQDGERLELGKALVAPGNYHMCVSDHNTVVLNQEPTLWGVRPAVDFTFASAAKMYKENLIAVVLTGMGRDGTDGCGVVKKNGGYVIAESEETAVIYGMPKCVADKGYVDEVVPLYNVADRIVKAVYK